MPKSALPEHLKNLTHSDYPWGLRWIPRGWTAFKWGKPSMFAGDQQSGELHRTAPDGEMALAPSPIGEAGSWQISHYPDGPWYAWYFAFTTKGGLHFRIGARWDDVDSYVEFPSIAIKRVQ